MLIKFKNLEPGDIFEDDDDWRFIFLGDGDSAAIQFDDGALPSGFRSTDQLHTSVFQKQHLAKPLRLVAKGRKQEVGS